MLCRLGGLSLSFCAIVSRSSHETKSLATTCANVAAVTTTRSEMAGQRFKMKRMVTRSRRPGRDDGRHAPGDAAVASVGEELAGVAVRAAVGRVNTVRRQDPRTSWIRTAPLAQVHVAFAVPVALRPGTRRCRTPCSNASSTSGPTSNASPPMHEPMAATSKPVLDSLSIAFGTTRATTPGQPA